MNLCAECGSEMPCCGRAYWSQLPPEPRDSWYPTPRRNGWYMYGWRDRKECEARKL